MMNRFGPCWPIWITFWALGQNRVPELTSRVYIRTNNHFWSLFQGGEEETLFAATTNDINGTSHFFSLICCKKPFLLSIYDEDFRVFEFHVLCCFFRRSRSTILRIFFWRRVERTLDQWKSREVRMWWSSRFVAQSICTHFVCLILTKLISWSNLFLLVWLFKIFRSTTLVLFCFYFFETWKKP